MTDSNIENGLQQDVGIQPVADTSPATQSYQQSAQAEPMVPQWKVNEIVKARLAQDRAKYSQNESQSTDFTPQPSKADRPLTAQEVEQLIDRRADEKAAMQYAQTVTNEFANKVMSAVPKYSDYEQKVSQLNFALIAQTNPNLITVLNGVDNTGDVVYEMANNPGKFAALASLSQTHPHLAQMELNKLSASIKQNEAAMNEPSSREPLSHVTPSNLGTGNGTGKTSVRDEKRNPLLRG